MTVTSDSNLTPAAHALSRSEVIDAVARVVARQGPGRVALGCNRQRRRQQRVASLGVVPGPAGPSG